MGPALFNTVPTGPPVYCGVVHMGLLPEALRLGRGRLRRGIELGRMVGRCPRIWNRSFRRRANGQGVSTRQRWHVDIPKILSHPTGVVG